ncbi:carbon-nitrogen hydrolase family protein [Bradyrhizobium iriomotense]|uniref:Amidohydrolase n=1 Tax=Bradyrhizobium iriomotense TaxID=441950 RepID=A0ABQ6B9P6_9BRAD|nr:carbon-nitrogen hydrolase family protein [Bradyrhizobium iriomotense]GLR90420.1 amidohydrolase [Bradyrhizobium iriomotense]
MTITIATVQSHISADTRMNGRDIRRLMAEVRAAGARLVHFPEGALSGYVKSEINDWAAVDWAALRDEIEATAACASELGIWVVFGANHPQEPPTWPNNSLYVISDKGSQAGRYDKRLISHAEATSWYAPGTTPFVFEVDGYRFGCALCIEIHFPEIFTEYERLGVDCVLFSAYADDPMFGIEAQAHAAMNNIWLSLSTPATSTSLPCALIGPDGNPYGQLFDQGSGRFVCGKLDRHDPQYDIPLNKARPWRATVRNRTL